MKILICAHQEPSGRKAATGSIPARRHALTSQHIHKIREVNKKLNIAVALGDDAERHAADADIIVGFPATIPPIAGAKKVKWIHSFSAGMDRVLTPEVIRSPILVSNSSGVLKTPIAEHVIAFMLVFSRGFLRSLKNQEQRIWQRDGTLTELRGKTVLVVGLGNIGGEVARLSRCFGCHLIGVVRNVRERHEPVDELKNANQLEKLIPRADFVVSCLPHTKETHHLFNLRKFKLMKPSAIFINIGRGGLVREKDLVVALKKKLIAGAGLDVTEIEPLPQTSPLWNAPNVVITPHHSGSSEQQMNRAMDRFRLNLKAFLAGRQLPNLVDKTLGY